MASEKKETMTIRMTTEQLRKLEAAAVAHRMTTGQNATAQTIIRDFIDSLPGEKKTK